jgi:hypothetical protein
MEPEELVEPDEPLLELPVELPVEVLVLEVEPVLPLDPEVLPLVDEVEFVEPVELVMLEVDPDEPVVVVEPPSVSPT